MTSLSRLTRLLPVATLAVVAAACGDDDPIAPIATLPVSAARLDALAASLEQVSSQPVLREFTFSAFEDGLPGDGGLPIGVRASVAAPPMHPVGETRVPTPTVPDSLRGRTYVRDGSVFSLRWRLDTLPDGTPRPGAPANAVRLVLQEPGTEAPARVGWMDVTQQGSASAPTIVVSVHDLAGALVQRMSGSFTRASMSGFTQLGATVIDEVATLRGGGMATTWRSTGLGLSAFRNFDMGRMEDLVIVYGITVDGTDLRLQSVERLDELGSAITYTVLANGAPFARLERHFGEEDTWEHIRDERPLNASEQAQVDALVRALAALPNAAASWEEGVFALMSLQSAITF